MRYKVELLGQKDCLDFCQKAQNIAGEVSLISQGGKYRVNAKSIMSCMLASAEWGDDVWVESEVEIYFVFKKWINDEVKDGNFIHE